MKKVSLLLVSFVFAITIKSQIVVNVEPGMSVSRQSFIYSGTLVGISAFAGAEYLDFEITREINMSLSSNLGYIKKGGKFANSNSGMFSDLNMAGSSLSLNFISVNTTADFKYLINKSVFPFIGVGPYLDMLVSYKNDPKQFYELEKPRSLNGGALINLGVKYIYDDFQFGFKFNYFIGLNKTSSWLGKGIWPNSFSIGLVGGYTIK